MRNKELKSKKGITLIALVVTIVVLLILAAITINLVFSENGIIKKAQDAAEAQKQAEESDRQALENLADQLDDVIGAPKELQKIMSKLPLTTNQKAVDSYGNKITIPAGFIVVADGTDNVVYSYDKKDGTSTKIPVVQDGIVIKNATDGNEFVWVPVGTIKNDAVSNTTNTTTIKLGRYSSFTVTGNVLPNPAQEATTSSYNTPVGIELGIEIFSFEVSDSFAGGEFDGTTYGAASSYGNTKATNLQEWISTTLANGGYYIARYEASQNETDTTKAASLPSKTVWGDITQPAAATAAKATYSAETGANKDKYYSDLINSYAWDTAIVFIEAYADSNYAEDNNSTSFTTTGGNGDQVCNINDMSGNVWEWTTETSTYSGSVNDYPCAGRGGYYSTGDGRGYYYTSLRNNSSTGLSSSTLSFRATLCVK